MESFATVDDLARRWRAIAPGERDQAEALLGDASAIIRATADTATVDRAILTRITCAMVARAMTSLAGAGIRRETQMAGPYQHTVDYANPTGDVYLTKAEKSLLGRGAFSAGEVDLIANTLNAQQRGRA